MPFSPGTPKPPNSGRKKGVKNTVNLAREVRSRLEEVGCDPIVIMADIAQDAKVPVSVRLRAALEVAQYVYPKRRAVEHTGLDGGPINVSTSAKDALEARIIGIRDRLRDSGVIGSTE